MSSTISEDRILAGCAHLMIIFGWMGTALALVIWLVRKDRSAFVKKSAKQAVAFQVVALLILRLISKAFGGQVSFALGLDKSSLLTSVVGLIWAAAALALFLYGAAGAAAGFRGRDFKYAVIGDYVDKMFN